MKYKSRLSKRKSPPKISKKPKIVNAFQPIGGSIVSAGSIVSSGSLVNPRHHYDLINALHHMSDSDFRIVQQVAGGALNLKTHMTHALHDHFKEALFEHPAIYSKIATRDIVKALNPHHLAKLLHSELADFASSGKKFTGGGLFDSARHFLKKTARLVGSKVEKYRKVGERINNGLKIGIALSDKFSPAVQRIFGDKVHNILHTATNIAKISQSVLEKTLDKTEAIPRLSTAVANLLEEEKEIETLPITSQ
jgi:hypothetical protein